MKKYIIMGLFAFIMLANIPTAQAQTTYSINLDSNTPNTIDFLDTSADTQIIDTTITYDIDETNRFQAIVDDEYDTFLYWWDNDADEVYSYGRYISDSSVTENYDLTAVFDGSDPTITDFEQENVYSDYWNLVSTDNRVGADSEGVMVTIPDHPLATFEFGNIDSVFTIQDYGGNILKSIDFETLSNSPTGDFILDIDPSIRDDAFMYTVRVALDGTGAPGSTYRDDFNDGIAVTNDITYSVDFVENVDNTTIDTLDIDHGFVFDDLDDYPDTPEFDSHVFDSWDFSGRYTGDPETITATYDINEYTVTFDADGGSPTPDDQTYEHGDAFVPPEEPEKENFEFAGWGTYNPVQEQWIMYPEGTTIEFDVDLTARWEEDVYSVSVTENNVSVTGTGDYAVGDTVTLEATADEGHTFSDWTGDFSGSDTTLEFTMPAENVNITATADINEYTVTYNADGGTPTPSDQTYEHGDSLVLPDDPSKPGFTFDFWGSYNPVQEEWIKYTDGTSIESDVDLTAQYIAIDEPELNDFTGTLEAASYSFYSTDNAFGSTGKIGLTIPDSSSFQFIQQDFQSGVRLYDENNEQFDFIPFSDLTTDDRVAGKYVIESDEAVSYDVRIRSTLSTIPGQFLDWLNEESSVTGDPEVTITFIDDINDEIIDTRKATHGSELSNISFPTPPELTGYEFDEWSQTEGELTQDTEIRALYTGVGAYQVSVDIIGGGNVSGAGMYTVGDTVTLEATPGFASVFEGWTGDFSGNDTTLEFTMPSESVNITATFEVSTLAPVQENVDNWLESSGLGTFGGIVLSALIIFFFTIFLSVIKAPMIAIIITDVFLFLLAMAFGFIPLWVVFVFLLGFIGLALMYMRGGASHA